MWHSGVALATVRSQTYLHVTTAQPGSVIGSTKLDCRLVKEARMYEQLAQSNLVLPITLSWRKVIAAYCCVWLTSPADRLTAYRLRSNLVPQRFYRVHYIYRFNSVKEVLFSSTFGFFCKQYYAKTAKPIFTNFGRNVVHGARKKWIDFGSNPDQDTL